MTMCPPSIYATCLVLFVLLPCRLQAAELSGELAPAGLERLTPAIVGPWWQVSGDPDLGQWTTPEQQPVDFAVWKAADGSWQLWSCIRRTACGGQTRLFYRWEGGQLTAGDWRPMGIAMTADAKMGETPGGLQAPHVVVRGGLYYMLYGDWRNICLASSRDGKAFQRVLNTEGAPQLFSNDVDGVGNTRDAMAIEIDGRWHCYYTAFPGRRGAVYCRTSADLLRWSDSKIVAAGGSTGWGPSSSECPFVVQPISKGPYYLFRTQRYGKDAQTSVYCSHDPLNFGVDDDRYLICRLQIAAPELIYEDGQWYVAALKPSLKGIQIAKLAWR